MTDLTKEGWAVTILSFDTESDLTKRGLERIIIAVFAHEHNAKFYVEKTYKHSEYLKPEIRPVRFSVEPG